MKITTYFYSFLATLLVYSTTVSAQTLSISVGEADYDGIVDDTSITLAAAFPISESIALEVSYNDLGEVTASEGGISMTLEATSFDILIVGSTPLNEKVNAFGKVGFSRWELDASVTDGVITESGSVDGTDPTFAAGLEMTLNEQLSGNLQWQRIQAELDGEDIDVDKISLGLSWDL